MAQRLDKILDRSLRHGAERYVLRVNNYAQNGAIILTGFTAGLEEKCQYTMGGFAPPLLLQREGHRSTGERQEWSRKSAR